MLDEIERRMIERETIKERGRLRAFLAQIDETGTLGTSRWAHNTEDDLIIADLCIGSPPRDNIPYNCLALTERGRAVLDAGGDITAA